MKSERLEQSPDVDQINGESDKRETHFKNVEVSEQPDKTEISSAEVVSEKLESAEGMVSDLATDGQRRIDRVEQSVNLPIEDTAAVREEVGLISRFEKIKNEASILLEGLKEKFSRLLFREKNSDSATEQSEYLERLIYGELKEYLKHEQREIRGPVIEEAKRKRNQLLEARGLFSMSKEDFNANFSSKEFEVRADLKQQNVGDCYAVAAIHAMSRSPHFETICRSSMEKLPDGSWQVRVPLMSENGQVITITPEELLPQKNRQFLKRGKKGEILPDLRRKLMPVEGKEGLQVLEAAFIKQKFGSVDRLAAEGGWGDDVLLSLGGDNFVRYRIDSTQYNSDSKKWEYPGLGSLSGKAMAHLDYYLENFDPEVHIATVSTKHTFGDVYRAKGTVKFLVSGHAYSISSVDAENKIVNLANPWNTSKPIKLTFDQFKENFSNFNAIRIDSAKLLRNMSRVVERRQV